MIRYNPGTLFHRPRHILDHGRTIHCGIGFCLRKTGMAGIRCSCCHPQNNADNGDRGPGDAVGGVFQACAVGAEIAVGAVTVHGRSPVCLSIVKHS